MTSLKSARDLLAREFRKQQLQSWKFEAGFDAAIAHLESAAGTFDESAALHTANDRLPGPDNEQLRFVFRDGARTQFEADKARIGLADWVRDSYRKENEVLRGRDCIDSRILKDRDDKIKLLEARIKELEANNKKLFYDLCKMPDGED